ncbi:Hypothetical protein, putative, partial [Bodo saltans]
MPTSDIITTFLNQFSCTKKIYHHIYLPYFVSSLIHRAYRKRAFTPQVSICIGKLRCRPQPPATTTTSTTPISRSCAPSNHGPARSPRREGPARVRADREQLEAVQGR